VAFEEAGEFSDGVVLLDHVGLGWAGAVNQEWWSGVGTPEHTFVPLGGEWGASRGSCARHLDPWESFSKCQVSPRTVETGRPHPHTPITNFHFQDQIREASRARRVWGWASRCYPSFFVVEDPPADELRDLRDNAVAESSESVHPMGHPMSHSTHVGFRLPSPSNSLIVAGRED
jgi:hypothetical protein